MYAVSFKHCPEIPTVSYGLKNLISSDVGVVDEEKVKNKIEELRTILLHRIGEDELAKELEALSCIKEEKNALIKYVSAKDYLMPLLYLRIRRNVKTTAQNINLKYRASLHCDLSNVLDLEHYILP
jgi:hypothetical protein